MIHWLKTNKKVLYSFIFFYRGLILGEMCVNCEHLSCVENPVTHWVNTSMENDAHRTFLKNFKVHHSPTWYIVEQLLEFAEES